MEPIYPSRQANLPRNIQVANDFSTEILSFTPLEQNEMIAVINQKVYQSRIELIEKLETEARTLRETLGELVK